MKKVIRLNAKDNVATALDDLNVGDKVIVDSMEVKVITAVPFEHKIALAMINEGEEIIKYGEIIGLASQTIRLGDWVHVHNLDSARFPTSSERKV